MYQVVDARWQQTIMAQRLTFHEYADIRLVYGEVHQNSLAARRRYQRMFPNRRIPHRNVFKRIDQKLREFGHLNFNNLNRGRPRNDDQSNG
jgi:hypothetical protein